VLIVVASILVVGAVVVGLGGLGLLGREKPDQGLRPSARDTSPAVLLGALLALVMVFGTAALFLVGGIGTAGDEGAGNGVTTRQRAPEPEVESPPHPVVAMRAATEDRFADDSVISAVRPGSVVQVRASGFRSFEMGVIEQCVNQRGRPTGCTAAFPVQFGEEGQADFQFELRDTSVPDLCRRGRPTCLLQVTGRDSGRTARARALYVDAIPSGQVHLEPSGPLREGQPLAVSVTGFPPDTLATAMMCAPPWGYDADRCGAPGETSTFPVGADGSGHTTFVVRTGPVGNDGVLCGSRETCAVSVVADESFVAAPVVPIRFARGTGASYTPWRLAAGLALALALFAVAVGLARATDWAKPTEADAPDLDNADLQADADLDDRFIEPGRAPVPSAGD